MDVLSAAGFIFSWPATHCLGRCLRLNSFWLRPFRLFLFSLSSLVFCTLSLSLSLFCLGSLSLPPSCGMCMHLGNRCDCRKTCGKQQTQFQKQAPQKINNGIGSRSFRSASHLSWGALTHQCLRFCRECVRNQHYSRLSLISVFQRTVVRCCQIYSLLLFRALASLITNLSP